jgi:hypothetical protein
MRTDARGSDVKTGPMMFISPISWAVRSKETLLSSVRDCGKIQQRTSDQEEPHMTLKINVGLPCRGR